MFDPIATFDPLLDQHVKQIESTELGLKVVAGAIYEFPRFRFTVACQLQSQRRIKVLEEFLIRIGLDVQPSPTLDEAATILGLDSLFIKKTFNALISSGAVLLDSAGRYSVSPTGQALFDKRMVLGPIETENIDLEWVPEIKEIAIASRQPKVSKRYKPLPNFIDQIPSQDQSEYLKGFATYIQTQHETKDFVKERILVGLQIAQSVLNPIPCAVFFTRDTLTESESNLDIRIIDIATGNRMSKIEAAFSKKLAQKTISLSDFAELQQWEVTRHEESELPQADSEDEVVKYSVLLSQYKQQMREFLTWMKDKPTERIHHPTIKYIKDREIRPKFLELIQNAKNQIVIISPWMSDAVVDDEFIGMLQDAANRGVTTLIGWGIAQSENYEDRPPSFSVINKLNRISDPEGRPAVMTWWIGNQHRKNVMVDGSSILTGSHNFLSYRGDFKARGEEAIFTTEPQVISEVSANTKQLFSQAAQRVWDRSINSNIVVNDLLRCCITWLHFDNARRVSINIENWPKRIPLKETVVSQLTVGLTGSINKLPTDYQSSSLQMLNELIANSGATKIATSESVKDEPKPSFLRSLFRRQ